MQSHDGNESVSDVSYIDAEPVTGGYLDETFGTDGVVVENAIVGAFFDVALLSDGSVVAVFNQALDSRLFIYSSDGSSSVQVDLSDPSVDLTRAHTVVVDEDDNIYVAGREDGMRVCKFDSDGNLDTTFGEIANPGCYYRGAPPSSRAQDIIIHPSGDLILAGYITDVDDNFAVWRFTADGSLVWEYTYAVPGDEYQGEAVTVQGDRIIAAGTDASVAVERLIVVSLDFSGGDEIIQFNSGAGSLTFGYGIASAPDGSVVVAGHTIDPGAQNYVGMWNYPTDLSSVDFYTYTLTTGVGLGSIAYDIQYDCRDRIVTSGADQNVAVALIAMRTDDVFSIDTSFGDIDPTNGWFLFDDSSGNISQALIQDGLGRIYIVGTQNDGVDNHPLLMRLQ